MAGRGPAPKDPKARVRRNQGTAATKLVAPTPGRARQRAPELPARDGGWHELTQAWWRDLWASPMAPEYDPTDVHGLYLLAELIDRFWREPSKELAAEIRLQRQCYGLSPIDRRRLEWEIAGGGRGSETTGTRRSVRKRSDSAADPYAALRAV
jgi:hypothetical protein